MILKLVHDLPDDVHFVPLSRRVGRGLLEFLQVVPQDIGDVETIVTELVANVVTHARSANGRFQVVLEFYAERVLITVIDAGPGFSFRDVPEVGTSRPAITGGERLGGFGLPMIDALSDKLEFRRTDPQGTTVRAEKNLGYVSQRDADDAAAMNNSAGVMTVSNG
jgi:anti-sigma regulatory factor (Ser/Thr protein kinase)